MSLTKLSNINLLDMPDCVGLMENGRCSRLNITYCAGNICPLKLTRPEEIDSRRRSMERLRSLDEQTQAKIAGKYYGGRRVWRDECTGSFKTASEGG